MNTSKFPFGLRITLWVLGFLAGLFALFVTLGFGIKVAGLILGVHC